MDKITDIEDNDEISYSFSPSQEILMEAFHKKRIFVEIGDFVYQPSSLTFFNSGRIAIDVDDAFTEAKIKWDQ